MLTLVARTLAFTPQQIRRSAATSRLFASTTNDASIPWSTNTVRRAFIDYFVEQHDHSFQRSSACAPLHDPTLLFTNAGMNQFKPIFLGQADPNSPLATLRRACNAQKCIRAGGKHNDLDDVGRDTYHHTFFEMLGSWSFGDYFKQQAIDMAWDLLTKTYGLDPERLYATYFEGDDNVPMDTEARDYWLQYLPAERVLPCGAADNFWDMGDTGPCGPCTEVHYDRIGGGRDASALVNADDPDVIEIWNLVFIQYNREASGLQPLPAQHVDTGMGLERLVSILQDKTSNYDIDCFQPLFAKMAEHSQVGPYEGKLGDEDVTVKDTAYRAIVDHARTLCFAIADGAIPNNEGRGYVLRRILRRATRYGQQILKAPPGFLSTLVPVVVDTFGEAYPELVQSQDRILEVVKEEEESFGTMLDRGIKYFSELKEELAKTKNTKLAGEQAFFLYDTMGFPLDLTELMAEEAGLTVDTAGFAKEMETQKQRSRAAQKAARMGDGPDLELVAEQTAALADQGVLPTDDGFKFKWDVQLPGTVMAVFSSTGFLDTPSKVGDSVGLILDKSTFYAESGGQEADTGTIEFLDADGKVTGRMQVTDVQVFAGYVMHKGVVEEGEVSTADHVNCKVDYERRRLIAPNHSMTHVLNAALRQVLGDDVDQRGSLCNDEKLRFDFSCKKAMTAKQLKRVEEICQATVQNGEAVTSELMSLADANEINGVRAVFGEVYPDPVRVVRIGEDTSVEFCGGTHMENTQEAESFVILEESAVAKGIRRITAVTKSTAVEAQESGAQFVQLVEAAEGVPDDTEGLDKKAGALRKDLDDAFISAPTKSALRTRIEGIQKRANDAKKKVLQKRLDSCIQNLKSDVETALANDESVLVLSIDIGADSKSAQKVTNTMKSLAPNLGFLGLSEEEPGSGGKLMAFACVPDSLVSEGLKADEWVRASLSICGGRGGGKPGNAQGQAKECKDVDAVVQAAQEFADEKVKTPSTA